MLKLFQVACPALLPLLGVIPVLLAAQEAPTASPPPPPKPQFFAGTVTDVNPGHVTVSRTLFGHPPEIRTFIVRPQTKTNRSVRVKSRVTVRYQSLPDGDVALEIQVRSQPKPPPKPS